MEAEVAEEDFLSLEEPFHQRCFICSNCDRPNRICLCHTLPLPPIQTTTQILIIQHPHKALHKSLLCTSSLTANHLRNGLSPLLNCFL
ncbi:hypothetical protein GmHk_14G041040 [Glycine max]|nr:hypothetical protein GmHk_14G041040 [Glycine max]